MKPHQPAPLAVDRLEDRLTPASPLPTHDLIATGAGVGSRPVVQLYRPDGSIRSQFFAFDPAFTGGVSVAMADVNADGVKDLIAAAGAGGGPHVKVFDGASLNKLFDPTQPAPAVVVELTELHSFFAYDRGFTGGVSVAAGDVDADGYADVVTGAGAGGGPHVKVFSGKTGKEFRSFFAFAESYRGGVNVAAGRITDEPYGAPGRIHADILVGSGGGMPTTVVGFDGRTGESFFTQNPFPGFTGAAYVAAGDIDGDSYDDVVIGAGAGGGSHVVVYDGNTLAHLPLIQFGPGGLQPVRSFFAYGGFGGGVRVAAADVDGDGQDDIVTGAGRGGGPHLKAFHGTDLAVDFDVFKFGLTPGNAEYTSGVTVGA